MPVCPAEGLLLVTAILLWRPSFCHPAISHSSGLRTSSAVKTGKTSTIGLGHSDSQSTTDLTCTLADCLKSFRQTLKIFITLKLTELSIMFELATVHCPCPPTVWVIIYPPSAWWEKRQKCHTSPQDIYTTDTQSKYYGYEAGKLQIRNRLYTGQQRLLVREQAQMQWLPHLQAYKSQQPALSYSAFWSHVIIRWR